MKKIDILNLVKSSVYGDERNFKQIVRNIAEEFDKEGDQEFSDIIQSLISKGGYVVPQSVWNFDFIDIQDPNAFFLPKKIQEQIVKVINTIDNGLHIYPFVFMGNREEHKREIAQMIARITKKNFYSFVCDSIEDIKKVIKDFVNSAVLPNKGVYYISCSFLKFSSNYEGDEIVSNLMKEASNMNAIILSVPRDFSFLRPPVQNVIDFDTDCPFEEKVELGIKTYNSACLHVPTEFQYDIDLFQKILRVYYSITCACPYYILQMKIKFAIAITSSAHFYKHYINFIEELGIPRESITIEKLKSDAFTIDEIATMLGVSAPTIVKRLKKDKSDKKQKQKQEQNLPSPEVLENECPLEVLEGWLDEENVKYKKNMDKKKLIKEHYQVLAERYKEEYEIA